MLQAWSPPVSPLGSSPSGGVLTLRPRRARAERAEARLLVTGLPGHLHSFSCGVCPWKKPGGGLPYRAGAQSALLLRVKAGRLRRPSPLLQ